ncbi:alpha/beta hydrolase [Luteimonas terricola]|uniref:Alpha/beta hydrolase n=1 Tax=Luteimonas terricola TaxID=645597 RepID=A0ABQ2EE70_9GAMM|nr:alpha/beta hydrolase [Luteimonas terricola]GGK03931.1 alpha/beta hydrolase [Luteimonas terricola]
MLRIAALLVACLLAAGFTSWPGLSAALASHLVAPGGTSPLLPPGPINAALSRLQDRSGHVTTGGGIEVFWRAIEPGSYDLHMSWPQGLTVADTFPTLDFDVPSAPASAPRGTVVLLHGWMMHGDSMLPWALRLGEAGYRTIAIDLRNHGRSGEGRSGYGTREADDVVDVVAALRERGEVTGPLHLLGVSYGAATAIFAGADPRLQADTVVAMESFAVADIAIRDMVPYMLADAPAPPSAWPARQWMKWRLSDAVLDAAIDQAGSDLGLPLDGVDVIAALAHVPCPLLVHGDADRHVPVEHGRALAASAPHARYIEMRGEDHLSLPMQLDALAPAVVDWFDQPGCRQPAITTASLD